MEEDDRNTKRFNIKIDSFFSYIQLFNGIFNLTKTEMEVLAEFMRVRYIEVRKNGNKKEPNVFNMRFKKVVADKLGRDNPETLNNYIKGLKDKGAIYPNRNGRGYRINKILIPGGKREEVIITIN